MYKREAKKLVKLIERLEVLKSEIEELAVSKRDKYEDMSEKLQEGEKGQIVEEEANVLEQVLGHLQEAHDAILEI